jgi:hypothetical protein
MYHIGIVTHNRWTYLDLTLRSLSGSRLPLETELAIFDDSSFPWGSRMYYESRDEIEMEEPRLRGIDPDGALGLSFLPTRWKARGIEGLARVERVAAEPVGVVNASCHALVRMMQRHPSANGFILLQDDVVFNADWMERMLGAVDLRFRPDRQQGIVAGMTISGPQRRKDEAHVSNELFASAQIYMFRPKFLASIWDWLTEPHEERRNWDKIICRMAIDRGFEVHLLHPFVGQHFGVLSEVRPDLKWGQNGGLGRVGLESDPPYAFADQVANFNVEE